MSTDRLKLAVLTDFHAFCSRPGDKGNLPSWLDLAKDQSSVSENPFASLFERASRDQDFRADVVLCCGDMGDKANFEGQQYVWREVNRLKDKLGAQLVLGAAGNHDVDSRHVNGEFDARGQLQSLEPRFPIADERNWLEYWARNFTITQFGNTRFVLLNTAAYHGETNASGDPEYLHGRISDRTIDRLVMELAATGRAAANVLICHHHPFKNDRVVSADYSEMRNGDRLINALVDAKVGPWLIVHGHKHDARVFYAPGPNAAPTIFSAASFSARSYPNQYNPTFNEFYILELEVPAAIGALSNLRGQIRTYNWSFSNGWRRPASNEGFGPRVGFGARLDTGELAAKIVEDLQARRPKQAVDWAEIAAQFKDVDHLIPEDLGELLHLLQDPHGCRLNRDFETNAVSQVQAP